MSSFHLLAFQKIFNILLRFIEVRIYLPSRMMRNTAFLKFISKQGTIIIHQPICSLAQNSFVPESCNLESHTHCHRKQSN